MARERPLPSRAAVEQRLSRLKGKQRAAEMEKRLTPWWRLRRHLDLTLRLRYIAGMIEGLRLSPTDPGKPTR